MGPTAPPQQLLLCRPGDEALSVKLRRAGPGVVRVAASHRRGHPCCKNGTLSTEVQATLLLCSPWPLVTPLPSLTHPRHPGFEESPVQTADTMAAPPSPVLARGRQQHIGA